MGFLPLAFGDALSDRYTLQRELGRGEMATVYLAHDLRGGGLVVLKVLRLEVASAVGGEQFLREIRLTSQLTHRHIVGLLDSGQLDGLLYYSMQYVAGESLRARLTRHGPLAVDQAIRITREIAAALGYAHTQGVVHRDIKPENILLESREPGAAALVADFGIAQALSASNGERLTATGIAIGTPAYMSPEQASGQPVDARSDIYSLGCVLYEMLGGEPPYTGPTGQAIIAKRFHEPVPHLRALRPEVPVPLEQAVTQALARSPADRFATAEAFAAALEPTGTIPIARPRRMRLTVALSAAAVLLAGSVVAGALLLRRPAASLPAAASAVSPDAHRIVVAVFRNQTGDAALDPLGDIVADYLGRGLAETRLVEVLDARAEQPGDSTVHAGGIAGARTLARTLGAGSVIWGSYARRGDSLEFRAQLTDATTGEPVAAIPPAMGSASQPTEGVEVLRQRVMSALAERFDPRLARLGRARLADMSASRSVSYEAYREFLSGEEIAQPGVGPCADDCYSRKLAHYRRAYALDTNFTLPLVQIAAMSVGGPCELVDSIAGALQPRRERLPPFDRAHLDWVVAQCHGQWEAALGHAREAVSLAPRSDRTVTWTAWLARTVGRLREAIAMEEKLGRTRERPYWSNLVQSHHILGEHQRELVLAQEARRVFPGEIQALRWETIALVGLGRLDEVHARVEEIARIPGEVRQFTTFSDIMAQIGRELLAHGYRTEAQTVFERGIRWIEARSAAEQRDLRPDLAGLLYDAERWDDAHQILKQLAAETPGEIAYQADLGRVAAHRGDRQEVARVDRWLAARRGPYLNGAHTVERAYLAAILGDRERAVAFYGQALAEGYGNTYQGYGDLHSIPDFQSLRDYPPFQELTRPKE